MNEHDKGRIASMARFGAQLEALATEESRSASASNRPARLALVGGAVAAAIALAGVTPPGQAVAERLGELVGIGDPPSDNEGRTAVVIGAGEANAYPYEVVASSADPFRPDEDESQRTTCVFVEFPAVSRTTAGNCLTDAAKQALANGEIEPVLYGAPSELYPEAEVIVQALVPPAATQVEVAYTDSADETVSAPVGFSRLSRELSEAIGTDEETGFAVAFLDSNALRSPERPLGPLSIETAAALADTIDVVAYDADGNEIASRSLAGADFAQALVNAAPSTRFADPAALQEARVACARELAERGQFGPDAEAAAEECVLSRLADSQSG